MDSESQSSSNLRVVGGTPTSAIETNTCAAVSAAVPAGASGSSVTTALVNGMYAGAGAREGSAVGAAVFKSFIGWASGASSASTAPRFNMAAA